MTVWTLVSTGIGFIASGVTILAAVSRLQHRHAKVHKYPEARRSRYTTKLARIGGAGYIALGILAVLIGFFGDRL